MVAEGHAVDISEVERWSRHEGKGAEYAYVKPLLQRAQQKQDTLDTVRP